MKKSIPILFLIFASLGFTQDNIIKAAKNFVGVYSLLSDNEENCAQGLIVNFHTYQDGKRSLSISEIGTVGYVNDEFLEEMINDPQHLLIDKQELPDLKQYISFKKLKNENFFQYKFHLIYGEDQAKGKCLYQKLQTYFDF